MSTCSEPNVRILPQATFAPGSVGNNSKCAELPSAAPPTHTVMTPAMQPMSAPPAPGSVSCHEKHAAVVVLRTFGTQNDIFCAFLRQNGRERPTSVSCHESPCQYPVTRRPTNFSKLGQTGQNKQFDTLSIPCRYPIFPKIRSHFTTQYDALGSILDRIGRILDRMRGATGKETDATIDFDPEFGTRNRNDPQRSRQLAPKAGCLHPCHRPIRGRNPRSATEESGGHPPVL